MNNGSPIVLEVFVGEGVGMVALLEEVGEEEALEGGRDGELQSLKKQ